MKKLHKPLSYFDFLLIATVVFGFVFVGIFLFRKTTYTLVTIKVSEDSAKMTSWSNEMGSRQWMASMYFKGMQEKDALNRINAEVIDVFAYDINPDTRVVYLTLKLRTAFTKATNTYEFKGLPLLIGSVIKMQLNNVLVEGMVTQIEGVKDPREKVDLIIQARLGDLENSIYTYSRAANKFLTKNIKVGDQVMDNNDQAIARVIDKKSIPSKLIGLNSMGQTIINYETSREVVDLKLWVHATKVSGKYFIFDDVPLQIGDKIPFITHLYSIWPEITSIEEVAQTEQK